MPARNLEELYELFDQLAGMTAEDRQKRMVELKSQNHPLIDKLEGLMLFHQQTELNDTIPNGFSEKLPVLQWLKSTTSSSEAISNAQDLRQLVGSFQWDPSQRYFTAGGYRIGKCLSFNAFSATYFAEDRSLGRHAALLLTYPRWAQDASNRKAFLDVTKNISSLFHPHVAAILGLVDQEGLLGIARQWIPGIDLASWLKSQHDLAPQQVALIIQRIAEGLSAIHALDVLHGDLKPANIIMRHGTLDPVIIDFGSAFSLSSNQNLSRSWRGGTLGYIAPEILQQQPYDHRLDFFSLGMMMRNLIDSCHGTDSQDSFEKLKILSNQLTSADPANRPSSSHEIIEQLTPLSGSAVVSFGHPYLRWDESLNTPVRRWTRRAVLASTISIGPFWAGRSASSWMENFVHSSNAFVPGKAADIRDLIRFPIHQPATEFIHTKDPKAGNIRQKSFIIDHPDGGFWKLAPSQQKAILQSDTYHLPKQSISHNWISTIVSFDTSPANAICELWVRNETLNSRWQKVVARSNYFGGPILRALEGAIDKDLLIPESELRFQIVMRVKQSQDSKNIPSVAVRAENVVSNLAEVFYLRLWYKEALQ